MKKPFLNSTKLSGTV